MCQDVQIRGLVSRGLYTYNDAMLQKLEKLLTVRIGDGKAFLVLFLVSALFVAPILFAGIDYIDDTSRKIEGAYQWGSLGRIVTEGLMHVLTFNFGTMTDPGNLMQLLSIPTLALTGYIIAKSISDGRKLTVLDTFIGVQVVLNQLLLTNLSFRFDSFSMVLGSLAAVTAAYMLLRKTSRRYISLIIAASLLFIAAGLYQSTVLMFGVVVVIVLVMRYVTHPGVKLYTTAIRALGIFAIGLFAYVAMLKLVQFEGLVGQRKEIVPFNTEGIELVFHNFKAGIKTVMLFVGNAEAFILAGLVVTVLVISLAILLYHHAKKRNPIDTIFVLLSPVFIVLLIMGPFVLMQASNLTTQVRVLTGAIGVMLLAAVVVVALYRSGYRWALWLLAAPLLMNFYSIGFAYVYGSTLKTQRAFDETVYESIVASVESDPRLQTSNTIFIGGEPASPQTVRTQFSKRPALKHMGIAGDNSIWYIWKRLHDEGIGNTIDIYSGLYASRTAADVVCSRERVEPEIESELYDIYFAFDGKYIIWLKDPTVNTESFCREI